METKGKRLQIVSSNKRERTVTIQAIYQDGTSTKYRTTRLSKEDYHYYSEHATERDLRQLLKTDEYYVI